MVVIAEQPAAAASSCYGDYCSGRDPSSTGVGGIPCANDGVTIQSTDIYSIGGGLSLGGASIGLGGSKIGQIELRWSNRCGTNWARLNTVWGGDFRHLTVNQQGTNYTQTNELLGVGQYYLSPGIYYTNMVYSPTRSTKVRRSMFLGYGSTYALLLSWLLILVVIIRLPALVRRVNLGDAIDARMQSTIRAALIAYLLVNIIVFLSGFVIAYLSGIAVWLHL